MIIKSIEIKNLKKIEALKQDFTGSVYLVKGENETGKSTLLSTIIALISGERSNNLLTTGKEKGYAKAILKDDSGEEYQVQISFTEKNPYGTIKITDPKGMVSNSKTVLQNLLNYKDFDANAFVSMSETAKGRREQVKMVESLLPSSQVEKMYSIKKDIADLKEEREPINSMVSHLKKGLKTSFSAADLKMYSEPKPTKELIDTLLKGSEYNQKLEGIKARYEQRATQIQNHEAHSKQVLSDYDERLNDAEEALERAKNQLEKIQAQKEAAKNTLVKEKEELEETQSKAHSHIKKAKPFDKELVEEKIKRNEAFNLKHEEVKKYTEQLKEFEAKEKEQASINGTIAKCEASLKALISSFNLPIEGLGFSDEGLTLNGIQFKSGEVSTSQEMIVAVRLIMAINPTVKVFRLSQGESLGASKLKALVDFANKEGYQGFIEEVKRGQEELTIEEYTFNEG